MQSQNLLFRLSELEVKLDVKDGKLHVDAPAGVLTTELQQAIGLQKGALIDLLQSARVVPVVAELTHVLADPAKRYEPFPLSDVQHAYWIGRSAQMELGSVSTHIYFELECGVIEPVALSESFRKVLDVHDMLRAVIDVNGMQRVFPKVPDYDITVADLRHLDSGQRDDELLRIRSELASQVFPCDQWPLFEIRLVQISDKSSRLCVSWDFLMVDGWSLMLIFRQWFGYYQGANYQVPVPAISFRDYLLAEAESKSQPSYQLAKKYWWERLDQLPPAPQLPVGSKIEAGRKHEFKRRRLHLPTGQWDVIKARARRAGLTPTSVLLTTFCETLNLWSAIPHYCLNLTLFNRLPLHPDVPNIVGDFTSLMALEIDARETSSFAELGARIQARFLRDYEHRQVSALEVMRELARRRGGQQSSFPVVFTSTLMLGAKGSDDAGLLERFGPMGYGISQTPQVWLDYQVFEVNGDLAINWDAVEEVFPLGVLDDMFESHRELLSLLSNNPDAWVQQHPAAMPEQQRQRRELVNDTSEEIIDQRLHELFIEKALEDPSRIAVAFTKGSMSYGELLAHSNLVAEEVIKVGVQPQELVAVVMQKGWEEIVAVLGILMAGAAYLPIDPNWPTLRRNHILQEADVRLVLTQPAFNSKLEWPSHVRRMDVQEQTLDLVAKSPPIMQAADDLAYVIFTSGSTGTPKGVMISHAAAVNTIVHVNRLVNLDTHDRVLAVSDLTFDLSVYDIFGTLAAGGAIVVPDAARSRDADHWQHLIQRYEVTIWNSAPPLMAMLVDGWESDRTYNLSSFRCVLLSGDWIPVALPDRIRRLSSGARVISLGGATEGSIWSIYHPIEKVSSDWDSIPYGKALANQHVYVLNSELRHCPELVTGNIYLGGLGVALGYWKDADKTARQFVIDPRTGKRLYHTGDLGRMRRDGNIEFLGRADSQVKLRGHRVELGEIAACLQSHPDVGGAAVQISKQDNRTLLTAYVVANRTGDSRLFEETEMLPHSVRTASLKIEGAVKSYLEEADGTQLKGFWEFWKDVELACIAAMFETLSTLELVDGSDASNRLDVLIAGGRVLPQYRRLVLRWLTFLADAGQLSGRKGRYTVSLKDIATAECVEDQLIALEQSYSSDGSLRGFVEHVAGSLRSHLSMLCGEVSPLDLLFPEGSLHVAESLYQDNAVVRHHNGVLAAIVDILVESSEGQRSLRVLDIGAGIGGTSTAVLPLFDAARTRYSYTDISTYFLNKARQKFEAYPFVEYSLYDLNEDPKDQGLELQSYDLIIASNVLHNALDTSAALTRIRGLLRPGGYLLVLDGTSATPWMWATVGFLEAAHSASGSRSESDQWALEVDDWLGVMAGVGFAGLQVFPSGDEGPLSVPLSAMPQHLFVAQLLAATRFKQEELETFLRNRLPEYMVPQRFVLLDKLPLTPNGKVDLAALPGEFDFANTRERQVVSPASNIEEQILEIWKEVLHVEQLSVTDNFFEVGGDSLLITEVMRRLNRSRQSPLLVAELLAYPTIRSLAEHLGPASNGHQLRGSVTSRESKERAGRSTDDVAIIGMAGRFPGADNIEQLWLNLAAGKCAVRNFSTEELLKAGVTLEELADANYVKAAFPLKDISLFDAGFFSFRPRDAEVMDPQQRFLLECSVEALDAAGYANEKQAGRIGVFVGKGSSLYLFEHVLPNIEIVQQLGMMPILNLNEKDHAATLISYKLNLTGPALNISTACSTSLVAVHVACESLLNHECEIALAGGVSLVSLQDSGYLYAEGHIMSPDGVCRAFSDDARGTVFGSGVGLVVLKPLASALRDRDTIHAVIKGSAINNDGGVKLSYTAPSLHGQAEVISTAHARAGASPDSIQMIEAHGTGTELGDPIEFGALRRVFGGPRRDGSHCSLGSLKTNIGHLDAAAGVAGLIKVVHALNHKQFPPTLHVRASSRKIDFADSPFELTTTLKDWPAGTTPRRAGVSSFGVGGTNAHVVLEEAPVVQQRTATNGLQVIPVSAKNQESLKGMMLAIAKVFGRRPELSLEDAAFTLQVGRNAYPYRSYIVCDQLSEAKELLEKPDQLLTESQDNGATPSVVFLLPGQGVLETDVTFQLYQNEYRFRAALDECAGIMLEYTGEDLRDWLYSSRQRTGVGAGNVQIEQTGITQPLLFSVEYALAKLWEGLGVRPAAMLGHSLGEYVAACISGVFSLPEALILMVVRGRLLQSLEPGQMLAVGCAETQLLGLIEGGQCSLAAVNGPAQCVVSGPVDAIKSLHTRLEALGITSSRLRTSHAFHSQMVEPILRTFENCVDEVEKRPPTVPFLSSVTGTWITDAEATSAAYWARHMRQTVRFSDGLQKVLDIKNRVLLEVGPGHTLSALARRRDRSVPLIAPLGPERSSHGEQRLFLESVGKLWVQGVEIDWTPLHDGHQPGRVPLPSYVFARKRYWIERGARLFCSNPSLVEGSDTAAPVDLPVKLVFEPIETNDFLNSHVEGKGTHDRVAEIEFRLLETWKTYLGIDNIQVHDSFFDLGGDSLLAGRVHSQIRRDFNVELPLARMFELQTIRRVSLYIAITRDPEVIESLSEEDVEDILAVMNRSAESRANNVYENHN